jgi:hypothetical protein
MQLRFNKITTRECTYEDKPTTVLEVNYSLYWMKWIAQVKDFTEEMRKPILRDLRRAIKWGFNHYKENVNNTNTSN